MSAAEKGETHELSAGCLFKNLKKLALVDWSGTGWIQLRQE